MDWRLDTIGFWTRLDFGFFFGFDSSFLTLMRKLHFHTNNNYCPILKFFAKLYPKILKFSFDIYQNVNALHRVFTHSKVLRIQFFTHFVWENIKKHQHSLSCSKNTKKNNVLYKVHIFCCESFQLRFCAALTRAFYSNLKTCNSKKKRFERTIKVQISCSLFTCVLHRMVNSIKFLFLLVNVT